MSPAAIAAAAAQITVLHRPRRAISTSLPAAVQVAAPAPTDISGLRAEYRDAVIAYVSAIEALAAQAAIVKRAEETVARCLTGGVSALPVELPGGGMGVVEVSYPTSTTVNVAEFGKLAGMDHIVDNATFTDKAITDAAGRAVLMAARREHNLILRKGMGDEKFVSAAKLAQSVIKDHLGANSAKACLDEKTGDRKVAIKRLQN
jgi:hypothetical protein